MDTIIGLFDTSVKRWLAVLVASVLASVAVLAHSFMEVLVPQENTITVEPSPTGGTQEVQSKSEPAWDNHPQIQGREGSPIVNRVSPFDNQRVVIPKTSPVVRQEVAHQQAEYLRGLIAAGKLPKGFGHLTKEKVDEMEKKGITID